MAGRVPVSFAFPTFLESMAALWVLTIEGTIFIAYAETLKPLVVGVLISAFLGIGLGIWIGLSRKFDWFVSPIFIVMQSAPLAALFDFPNESFPRLTSPKRIRPLPQIESAPVIPPTSPNNTKLRPSSQADIFDRLWV